MLWRYTPCTTSRSDCALMLPRCAAYLPMPLPWAHDSTTFQHKFNICVPMPLASISRSLKLYSTVTPHSDCTLNSSIHCHVMQCNNGQPETTHISSLAGRSASETVMQQASRLSRSFFLQHCTCPAVAPAKGVQLAYRVWRKPMYVAGRYLKLLRGVAQVCCAPPADTTGKEQRTPLGERPPEAAVDTTTCLIAPDPSSACAVFDDPTFGGTSAVAGLWLDCASASTVLAHQLCTCSVPVTSVIRRGKQKPHPASSV